MKAIRAEHSAASARHIRTPSSSEGEAFLELLSHQPFPSIDQIKARIRVQHSRPIRGHSASRSNLPSLFSGPPRFITVPTGVATAIATVRSLGLDSVILQFNPSQFENGHNLWAFHGDITVAVRRVFGLVLPMLPELALTRSEALLLRVGYVDLLGISFARDYDFPSYPVMHSFVYSFERAWRCQWNRRVNNKYATGVYFNSKGWSLLIYEKGEQLAATNPRMPAWMRERTRNRLRIELRVNRPDIRTLAARLTSAYPDMPLLDYGIAGNWRTDLLPLVFDLYTARLRPVNRRDLRELAIPVYHRLRELGAGPAWPSSPSAELEEEA